MKLADRTVVVVGGGGGWGRDAATRLADEGAHVLVLDTEQRRIDRACAVIAQAGGSAEGECIAIGDPRDLARVAAAWEAGGRTIHTLVTSYMAMDWSSFETIDIERFKADILFNLAGPLMAVQAFLPLLKKAEGASIIHIGSIDGLHGNPHIPSYSTSKGGLVPMTHIMAHEFAPYDIRVNAVVTGQTTQIPAKTGQSPRAEATAGLPNEDYFRQLSEANPLKRHEPQNGWAGAVPFLASADASFITGTILVVDCGRTAITHGTA